MKLKIIHEDDIGGASAGGIGGVDAGGGVSSMSSGMGDMSGINTSAGSNVVNYGPNNPYFSNLREQNAKKKRAEKKKYGSKNAGHRGSRRRNKYNEKYNDGMGW